MCYPYSAILLIMQPAGLGMKQKQLQSALSSIQGFSNPNLSLEQYETRPEVAANFLYQTAHLTYEDIEDQFVADLGCGPGTFLLGASLLGAAQCVGFEIDESALRTCAANVRELEVPNADLILCDLTRKADAKNGTMDGFGVRKGTFDTVIMNPPFGTKNNAGIDVTFLEVGLALTDNVLYSMHKSATRDFIAKRCKQLNATGKVLYQLRFDLPATYRFHKQASKDIEVDLWRIECDSS